MSSDGCGVSSCAREVASDFSDPLEVVNEIDVKLSTFLRVFLYGDFVWWAEARCSTELFEYFTFVFLLGVSFDGIEGCLFGVASYLLKYFVWFFGGRHSLMSLLVKNDVVRE